MNDLDDRLRGAFAARAERTTIDFRSDIRTTPVVATAADTPKPWTSILAIAAVVIAITILGLALILRPSSEDEVPATIPPPAPATASVSLVLAEDVALPGDLVQFDVISDDDGVGTGFETFLETKEAGEWKRIWQLSETTDAGVPARPPVNLELEPDPGIVGGARLGVNRSSVVQIPNQVSPGKYRLCRDLRGQDLPQNEICADLTISSG